MNGLELDGEKLSPLDYAIIGDGAGNSFKSIETYLAGRGGMSVTAIREMAAVAIQSSYRGFRARKGMQSNPELDKLIARRSTRKGLLKQADPAKAASHPMKCLLRIYIPV